MRELVRQVIRGEEGPRIAAAQQKLDEEQDRHHTEGDWFLAENSRLRQAEEAVFRRAERWSSRRA